VLERTVERDYFVIIFPYAWRVNGEKELNMKGGVSYRRRALVQVLP
jgi:hypothetical protein